MVLIGRRQAIGLGKESVAGTNVSPTVWIPKKGGLLKPSFEEAVDDSGWGRIEEVYDTQTTKNMTTITLPGVLRDDFAGHLFNAALGSHTAVVAVKAGSVSGGTPSRGLAVYQGATYGTATWKGTIKKITTITGPVTLYWVSTESGSLANSTNIKDSTDTITFGTVDTTTYAGAKGHYFSVLNTNDHPTYTLASADTVSQQYAPYGMMNTFGLTIQVGGYAEFESEWMAKQLVTTSGLTAVYTDANPFLAKHALVKFGATEADLNTATAQCVQSFKLNINKNITDIQCFGSTDIDSLHNQQFTLDGDMEALFENTTLRDYVVNSTKKATRLQFINTEATSLVTNLYPTIYVDLMKIGFKDWSQSEDQNSVVKQTMGYTGQYKAGDGAEIEILLINDETTVY